MCYSSDASCRRVPHDWINPWLCIRSDTSHAVMEKTQAEHCSSGSYVDVIVAPSHSWSITHAIPNDSLDIDQVRALVSRWVLKTDNEINLVFESPLHTQVPRYSSLLYLGASLPPASCKALLAFKREHVRGQLRTLSYTWSALYPSFSLSVLL